MERLFDKLSTPTAAVIVLVCFLAVNGFLLYRQSATPTASTPLPPSTTDTYAGAAPEESSELEGLTPDTPDTSATFAQVPIGSETPISGDLRESIRQCDGDRKECVRKFVVKTTPEASYIGGRIDLNPDGSGRNEEILYFEDPNLGTCEHTRQEYVTNDRLAYTVIILGQGVFESERGIDCIPET